MNMIITTAKRLLLCNFEGDEKVAMAQAKEFIEKIFDSG